MCARHDSANLETEASFRHTRAMAGPDRGFFGLDVRWTGDGDLPAGSASRAPNDDPNFLNRTGSGSICGNLDGTDNGAVSRGSSLWGTDLRLAGRSHRPGAGDDVEHLDLFGLHGFVLFRAATLAPGHIAICGGVRDGRRMVARRGVSDGSLATR